MKSSFQICLPKAALAFSALALAPQVVQASTQWDSICKQYKFKCLALPVAALPAGAIINKKSQALEATDCFTGNSEEARSLGAASQTTSIKSEGDLSAALGSYASAVGSLSQYKSIQVTFHDLSVKGFNNIHPSGTAWDVCHQNLKRTEMVGEVLYFGSMDIALVTQKDTEQALKLKEIQTQIGKVGAETKVSLISDNTLRVSGTALALGYKPMVADFDDKLSEETVKVNKIETIKGLLDADFEVEYFSPPLKSGANFRITNPAIPGLIQKDLKLDPHEPVSVAQSANYQATVELVSSSEKKAEVRLRQWNFKATSPRRL